MNNKNWKLSIKTDSERGHPPLSFCRENKMVGIGWHHGYRDENRNVNLVTPTTADEAWKIVKTYWPEKEPGVVRTFLFDVSEGDLMWIHEGGHYWLCQIGAGLSFGSQICPEYYKFDLGHARPARWVRVEGDLISGSIVRGCIAPITLQPIYITPQEHKCYEKLFMKLLVDPNWRPDVSTAPFHTWFGQPRLQDLASIMTPDDVEDLVSHYLQEQGWRLRKSSCFRSHPKFEFQMVHKEKGRGFVQVKSGNTTLSTADYSETVADGEVFLLAVSGVHGGQKERITILELSVLLTWAAQNTWALGQSLIARMVLSDMN